MNLANYYRPAEWHQQERIWLSWPNNPETWPKHIISKAQDEFAALIATISQFQKVNVLFDESDDVKLILKKLDKTDYVNNSLHLINIKTNDSWVRDYGPEYLISKDGQSIHVLDWGYNAWGGKYPPFDADNRIPRKIARHYNHTFTTIPYILEGGAVEFNGQGVIMTTEECLLNPNRNPQLSKGEIEALLLNYFQSRQIIWLKGDLVGDDTDGHIDNIARFINENTILCAYEDDRNSPNFSSLDYNWNYLKTNYPEFNLIKLPMPDPYQIDGMVLPASYANFLIINGAVIVPKFGQNKDQQVHSILKEHMKDREVIGLDSKYLIWGQGCFHCLSKQEPKIQEL